MPDKLSIGAVIFDGFELLDVFGPLEMFGLLPEHFSITMVAQEAGPVCSGQGPQSIATESFSDDTSFDLLLVPGGIGTRKEIDNDTLLSWLVKKSNEAKFTCSVCTGSALLAKGGVLDGYRATSNKGAFNWATSQSNHVTWVKEARWVEDRNVFTSSGVSAGIDMSLAVIKKILGEEKAKQVALWAEYEWHQDPEWDPFARIRGLV